jgi:hypothetical protein
MNATYQLNPEELNLDFFKSIKKTFEGRYIEISVKALNETEYLLGSPKNKEILLKRIMNVKEGKNLKEFSIEEFENII